MGAGRVDVPSELPYSLSNTVDVEYPKPKILIDHNRLALSNDSTIHREIDEVRCQVVKFDNRPLTEI